MTGQIQFTRSSPVVCTVSSGRFLKIIGDCGGEYTTYIFQIYFKQIIFENRSEISL